MVVLVYVITRYDYPIAALDSNEPDYEDGLIRSTAEALQVDAIISYDKKAFHKSFTPKYTASGAQGHFAEG